MKENDTPLYKEIYNDIKAKIENNEYRPGDKIPTELEISDIYAVSRITASRAVKELEQSGFIHRARKRGSIVNPPGLHSAHNGSGSFIPIILPFEMSNCLEIFDGAQSKAILNNYAISIYNSSRNENTERNIIESLLEMDTVGFIVWPVTVYGNLDIFSKLIINKKPLVFLDFPKTGIAAPCVSSDNENAMYELTNYVISKGHKNIAFYSTSIKNRSTESERYKGYINALIQNGIVPNREYIVEIHNPEQSEYFKIGDDDINFDYNDLKARQTLNYLMSLKTPPSAIICINDRCATHVEREALKMNIAIPETLSITGFDNRDICSYMNVPITTVKQNFRDIGKKAVELIIQIGNGENVKKNYLFATNLVERQSVADISEK